MELSDDVEEGIKGKKKVADPSDGEDAGEQPEYIPLPAMKPSTTAAEGDKVQDAAAAEGAVEEGAKGTAAVREAGRRPYWMSNCSSIKSPLLRLHQGEGKRDHC